MVSAVRNDIKKIAQQIENLAREVQVKIDQGGDPIAIANELVRNNSTFVFTLGEMYALEKNGVKTKKVKATNINVGYHNLRGANGRFRKV